MLTHINLFLRVPWATSFVASVRFWLRRVGKGVCGAVMALVLAGCASQSPPPEATVAYYAGDYRTALALAAPFENEFNRNFALNNLMLGSIYLGAGAYGPAMVPLRRAGKVMERTTTSWGNAFFSSISREDVKEYKGDPVERVMCHYYRGLLHYRGRDYDAALAAFRRALDADKDTMSTDPEATRGLSVIHYLVARCYELLGEPDTAATHYRRFAAMTTSKVEPGNVLLVMEWGDGPLKKRSGISDCMLDIVPRSSGIAMAKIFVDGVEAAQVRPQVSLAAHAALHTQTKASTIQVVKGATKQVVRALAFAGALTAVLLASGHDDHGENVGAGIAAGTGAAIIAGMLVRAERDVRIWDFLPNDLAVGTLDIPAGTHHIAVCYYDNAGTEIPAWRQVFYHYPIDPGDTLVYVRPTYCRFGSFSFLDDPGDGAALLDAGRCRSVPGPEPGLELLYPNPPALWRENQVDNFSIL